MSDRNLGTVILLVIAAFAAGILFTLKAAEPAIVLARDMERSRQVVSVEPLVSEERPTWPNQIMSSEDLVPGHFYVREGRFVLGGEGDYRFQILVLSKSYLVDGKCRFDSVQWKFLDDFPVSKFVESGFCSDAGLGPYDNGMWHRWNHLVPSSRESLSAEQLDAIKLFLTPSP